MAVYDHAVCGNGDTWLVGAVCLKYSLRMEEIGRFLCIAAKSWIQHADKSSGHNAGDALV